MYTYGPKDGHEGGWQDPAPVSGLQAICATGEPVYVCVSRFRRLLVFGRLILISANLL